MNLKRKKETPYNVIFCMDMDSPANQEEWDRESPTQRTQQFNIEYEFIIVFSEVEAIQIAYELKAEGGSLTVGFFDMCSKEVPNLQAISQIRRIFPEMICCISAKYTRENYHAISSLFRSSEEWLYFSHPMTQGEMKQTIRNLLTVYKGRDDRYAAMKSLKESKEGMRRILDSSPDLLKIRPLEELYHIILDHCLELTSSEHAFLAILNAKNELEYVSGSGKFISREVFDESGYADNLYFFQQVLNESKITMQTYGAIIPLRVRTTQVGVLFIAHHTHKIIEIELLDLFATQAAFAIENVKLHQELERKKALENEMSYAADIQTSLLPKKIPNVSGLELAGMMIPAKEVGGDYYDFIKPPDSNGIYIGIGDVSGKGLAAGMIMSNTHSLVKALCDTSASPKEIILGAARLLEEDMRRAKKFMSMLLIQYLPDSRQIICCSAGHEHILHWKAKDKKLELLKSGGIVLGTPYKMMAPFIQEFTITLGLEDMILLFTDGVTEARNSEMQMFGLENLRDVFEGLGTQTLSPRKMIDEVYRNLQSFTNGAEQSDDITLVALKTNNVESSKTATSKSTKKEFDLNDPSRKTQRIMTQKLTGKP